MLTIVFILLIIVGCLFCYVFFAPFYLELDSTKNLYRLRFHYLASLSFQLINDSLFLQVKILGWTKQVDLLAGKPKTEPKQPGTIQTAKKRKKSQTVILWKKIGKVLASFRINACRISIDLEDVRANALMYPIIYWVKMKTKKNITINFIGKNEIILEIENSLARMSWAYISSS